MPFWRDNKLLPLQYLVPIMGSWNTLDVVVTGPRFGPHLDPDKTLMPNREHPSSNSAGAGCHYQEIGAALLTSFKFHWYGARKPYLSYRWR